jgi:hypothetical protein
MAHEKPRSVVCGGCDNPFVLSARNAREARARGEEPRCHDCRHPAKPIDPAELERLRRWWLKRYSLDEIRELALGLWPELASDTSVTQRAGDDPPSHAERVAVSA